MNFRSSNPYQADIYIDLGTANTLVMTKDRGLVANEPSVIAYRSHPGVGRTIIGVGNEAKTKVGRTPGNLVASFPLKEGFIADLDTTVAMLKYFIAKSHKKFQVSRPRVVISLPYGAKDIEKQAVKESGREAGAREVILIEEPMAAAIGAGLPVGTPNGSMIIDIGGGTTDIAVISLFGTVHCESIRIGGYAFDQAICEYIRKQYNLVVGDQSAERLKVEIGSACPGGHDDQAPIRGIDRITGLPKEVVISSHQIHQAISGLLEQIFEAGRRTLAQVPPDLVPDIVSAGAKVAGGGALLKKIDQRLTDELGIKVEVTNDPLLAIARGGRETLLDPHLLERISI